MEFYGYNGNILKYDGNTITVPINNNVSSWTFNLSKNNNEEEKEEIRGGVGNKMYSTVKFSKGTQAQFDQIKDKSNIYKVDCYLNNDNGMIYFVIPSGVKPLKMEFDNNEEETQKEMNPFLQEYI